MSDMRKESQGKGQRGGDLLEMSAGVFATLLGQELGVLSWCSLDTCESAFLAQFNMIMLNLFVRKKNFVQL